MSDKNKPLSRRNFITGAAAAGVALSANRHANASTYKSILPQTIMGANEKIRTGHIGVGGMGKRDLQFCLAREDIQPIAVCDLLPENLEQACDMVEYHEEHPYPRPTAHTYFEEVIANKDVDAVVIVTPDHWHTIPTLMASQAGKDIFCEKPMGTTVSEGRAVVDEIKRSNVIYQGGTFQRSGAHFQEVVKLIREGYIGKVSRVETWIHDQEKIASLGPGEATMPEGLDWDRYLGWTPKVPFNSNRFIYNFRWFLDYSGGKVTDWGAHLMDIVVWAMGEDKQPKTITAQGGKFVLTDNRTTPDTLDVLYEFDDYILSFTNRVWCPIPSGNRYGIWFHGTLGSMRVDRMGYEVVPFAANGGCEPKKLEGAQEGDMNKAHWADFVDCIRSRKRCICDAPIIHNTTNLCHIGTAAYVAGGKLTWDNGKELFVGGDSEAVKKGNEFIHREYQNGWSLKSPYGTDLKA